MNIKVKNRIIVLLSLFVSLSTLAQLAYTDTSFINSHSSKTSSFKQGEMLKYRIHYGFINAGYATLEIENSYIDGTPVYHATGKGWTVGAVRFFSRIDDDYQSYFTRDEIKPVKFKRRISEDTFTMKRDLNFDHDNKIVTIEDLKTKTTNKVSFDDVQDLVSSIYFLRSIDISNINEGDQLQIDLFFDGETYPFKIEFIEKERIITKFGKIKTWRIRPMVQKGRVFEGEESLSIWITDDANKIPIRIKASLVVGAVKADLDDYKGIVESFEFVD